MTTMEGVLLELTVNNHPGVMSHVCGLFSRRAYNLEKILVIPKKDSNQSSMWLQVNEENKLEQIVKQIKKLEDVKDIVCYKGNDIFFTKLEKHIDEGIV